MTPREWLYGRNAVCEALLAQKRTAYRLLIAETAQPKGRLGTILHLASQREIPTEKVPKSVLAQVHPSHQGVALQVDPYPYTDLEEILIYTARTASPPFLLILDTLQDPQNLGAVIRTAEGVGVHGVILPLREAVGVTPAVVNASAGATEHLRIARSNLAQAIESLKRRNIWVIGLEDTPEAQPLGRIPLEGALALVVGGEGSGIRPLVRRACDVLARLPMKGKIHSYNAAVAGSIALYLAALARGEFSFS
ncbi:MAG: 23S rRNA (guanosine(2251)-2'-O)-methyltransferase RlmB [Anaerolineales bacterium]|nr:23S rRNA (guanosine(2251)-2'-O)-methyltransferase RlmB [Anaerolineales bacterium]MCS7248991.1 23S rRNA (guanosine(2251)-2'-O)-methyltransferase RlmB [Anaerolineales bacterium]MDW8162804.1 23S rRNA (guanosine(2251)-2'-O)-methyltransferase RlmB [Anaerolineales bacterium]MDW8447436.1 23S rRNA (guanosine(2251)-2'-O)-methyltransferase RlmB [Anaerolineales bacterium]